ncbi:MAG TPA: helix-turn-helix transcriptional regulator [Woeseiaceae bacterium]|nr:helix-turn-helix transcriptional regulator [Woeseiaceae bacterium]
MTRTLFERPQWHAAVAKIISSAEDQAMAKALMEAIGMAVTHEGTCLLAFHNNASPDVLHHTLEPAGRKHYLERYLAGPYLLDPLYQLAVRDRKPGLCRFRDAVPDRFRSSEYYRQYCERTHLLDEMDFLAQVTEHTTVVLVVGRRHRMFSKAELSRLQLIQPTVEASIRSIWRLWNLRRAEPHGMDAMHLKLTRCFRHFGESVLTDRERQICQLLLRGHSSKSIARELEIAPGTVMVHKRNLFAKLDISSQYELFSLLIDELRRS